METFSIDLLFVHPSIFCAHSITAVFYLKAISHNYAFCKSTIHKLAIINFWYAESADVPTYFLIDV